MPLINELIEKQRGKWTLTALVSVSFEDISQIIRAHIFAKAHLFDRSRPPGPLISTIVSRQISNIIESKYTNYTKPCFRCEAAVGDNGCTIYSQQCMQCPLYSRWMKIKGNALSTKLPVSLEDHSQEVHELPDTNEDLTDKIARFHDVITPLLSPGERKVYKWCYIDDLEDDEVKILMLSNKDIDDRLEPWVGKLKIIKANIIAKAKDILKEEDI